MKAGEKNARRILLAGIVLCLFCPACAGHTTDTVSTKNYVEQKLSEAAELISHDLALLTGSLERNFSPLEAQGGLANRMDLVFDGPLESALTRIAARAGYEFRSEGKERAAPVVVHVRQKNRSCLDLLRELGRQTGESEGILVSEAEKRITLTVR